MESPAYITPEVLIFESNVAIPTAIDRETREPRDRPSEANVNDHTLPKVSPVPPDLVVRVARS